jgi:Uma2 family endonuclease
MYDLPSEDPEELGLPDEFHDLQPQLLSATLRLSSYARDQMFTGTDLNLYTDAVPVGNGSAIRNMPPRKWEIYERILRVPYYIVFSRYTNRVRFFQLTGGRYQEQALDPTQPRIWIPELGVRLGLWQGGFEGVTRHWLRWYDDSETWIPTDGERAMQAEAQLRQVALNLLQQGMTVEQVAQVTGLSVEHFH